MATLPKSTVNKILKLSAEADERLSEKEVRDIADAAGLDGDQVVADHENLCEKHDQTYRPVVLIHREQFNPY